MYVCTECCELFETPRHITERHGLDTPPFEEQDVCPHCVGLAWRDAFYCDCCQEYVAGQYAQIENGERYCDACYMIKEIEDE